MVVSSTLSGLAVAYIQADGAAEADGFEVARVTATIVDTLGVPIQGAQVTFELSGIDPGAIIRHTDGDASITDALGQATADITTTSDAGPALVVRARAGDPSDGRINGIAEPTTTTVGNQLAPLTTQGATTFSTDGEVVTRTAFTGLVTVTGEDVTFTDCTFRNATAGEVGCISNGRGTRFERCTFTLCESHGLSGHGFSLDDCLLDDLGGHGISLITPQGTDSTDITGCLIQRVGRNGPSFAVAASPARNVSIIGSSLRAPHEASPGAVAGYQGRGPLLVATRKPSTANNWQIHDCWLEGGEGPGIRLLSLDGGLPPAGVRVLGCVWTPYSTGGDPGQAEAYHEADTVLGFIARGNLIDGLLDPLVNNRSGLEWLAPQTLIAATVTADFEEDFGPVASFGAVVFEFPITTPPVGVFAQAFFEDPQAIFVVHQDYALTSDPDDTEEAGEQGTGGVLDPSRPIPPVAVFSLPQIGSSSGPQPYAGEIEFDQDSLSLSAKERNITRNLTLTASSAHDEDITITFAYSGTAERNTDYTAPDTLTLTAGSMLVDLPLTLIEDGDFEIAEDIQITIAGVSEGLIGARSLAAFTITDGNNFPGGPIMAPDVNFTVLQRQGPEGYGTRFFVELDYALAVDTTITYVLENGTMDPSEFNDLDGGSITILAGDVEGEIRITTNDDANVEDTESIEIRLTAASGIAQLGDSIVATMIVFDDDAPPVVAAQFAQASGQMTEGGDLTVGIIFAAPVVGAATVDINVAYGPNLDATEIELLDAAGDPLVLPLTIADGDVMAEFIVRSVDDVVVETQEQLTLTLGTLTGNLVEGGRTEQVITIFDDDFSGSGSDGNLYGLAAERVEVDFTGAEIDVFQDRYEINANPGAGIAASTVFTSNPLVAACRAAQPIWLAFNAAIGTNLQGGLTANGFLDEGQVVRIRIHGDFIPTGAGRLEFGTIDDNDSVFWTFPYVRDLVIFGATGQGTDIIGPLQLSANSNDEVTTGPFAGTQRLAANIRFERLTIEGETGFGRCVGSIVQNADGREIYGSMKFYNVRFDADRTPSSSFNNRRIKWVIRCRDLACAWDIRGCSTALAEEHFFYVNSPQGDVSRGIPAATLIGNTMDAGGFGRTFAQIVNRPKEVSIPRQVGSSVFIRNIVRDNVTELAQGGSDFTFTSHGESPIYLVENQHIGNADSGSNGQARGFLTCWADHEVVQKGVSPFTGPYGNEFLTDEVIIRGEIVAVNTITRRTGFGFSATRRVVFEGFEFSGPVAREQMAFDRLGEAITQSFRYINGVPSEGPENGVFWNLAWPTWDGTPWAGSVSTYPGWAASGADKIKNMRSRRLANFSSEIHTLSDAEVDVFDGEVTWEEGTVLPDGSFDNARRGVPLGGTITLYVGRYNSLRSRRLQDWDYNRNLSQLLGASFTEVRSPLITEFSSTSGNGRMQFTLLDDPLNTEEEERPYWTITPTGVPDASGIGVIRYEITDTRGTADVLAQDTVDLFMYDPSAYPTIEWDPLLYPGGVHTVSIADGDQQFVSIVFDRLTYMQETVRVEINAGLSNQSGTGINNFNWTKAIGAVAQDVRLVSVDDHNPGEVLVLDILDSNVEDDGSGTSVPVGTIGSNSRLTITFTA